MPRISLGGLSGENLLAFLAALGTVRTIEQAAPELHPRLGWEMTGGFWAAWLELLDFEWTALLSKRAKAKNGMQGEGVAQVVLVDLLAAQLRRSAAKPACAFADDLTVGVERFREVCEAAAFASAPQQRGTADFLAAFGADGMPAVDKQGRMQDTAIRTMSGAGHQHFLASMRELIQGTNGEHLSAALFSRWEYLDAKPSMRWDPRDDRRYALRWKEPAGDALRTVRGANRLAIEALPLLTTAGIGVRLHTTGFSRLRNGVSFTWPLWEASLRVETIQSLVSLGELQAGEPDRIALAARGVKEVYRSQRITQGKYRNFAPAVPA